MSLVSKRVVTTLSIDMMLFMDQGSDHSDNISTSPKDKAFSRFSMNRKRLPFTQPFRKLKGRVCEWFCDYRINLYWHHISNINADTIADMAVDTESSGKNSTLDWIDVATMVATWLQMRRLNAIVSPPKINIGSYSSISMHRCSCPG